MLEGHGLRRTSQKQRVQRHVLLVERGGPNEPISPPRSKFYIDNISIYFSWKCNFLFYHIAELGMGHGVRLETCGMFLVMSLDGGVRLLIKSLADTFFLGTIFLSMIGLNQISSLNLFSQRKI
jgi:hypothetical protein